MKQFSLLSGAALATKIVPFNMAELDSAFQDIDGKVVCDTVAGDLETFTKYWGIDLKSTWIDGSVPEKQTLWSFLNLLDSEMGTVKTALGVEDQEQVSISAQLEDQTEEVLTEINAAKVQIQGTRGYNLEHIVYYVKQSEINTTDILHEIVDRLRFITDRLMTMEEALGVGYITDAGHTVYNEYVSSVIDNAEAQMAQGASTTQATAQAAPAEEEAPPAEFEATAN